VAAVRLGRFPKLEALKGQLGITEAHPFFQTLLQVVVAAVTQLMLQQESVAVPVEAAALGGQINRLEDLETPRPQAQVKATMAAEMATLQLLHSPLVVVVAQAQ
jgi:uncharacterized protein with NAD-binding domain and iron-sulfur cluster